MISSLPQVVGLFCLVLLSAFFSSAEISLSAASKTRLMALSEDGDRRAAMVLEMREHPGQFFSALQIGLNATALLGGIVGDAAFSPFFQWLLAEILPGQDWGRISFVISFLIDTLCNLCGSPPKTTGYCTSGSRSNVRCAPNALHHYALQTVRFHS